MEFIYLPTNGRIDTRSYLVWGWWLEIVHLPFLEILSIRDKGLILTC